MLWPCAQSCRIAPSVSGSFFPLLLSQWVTLGVALIGCKLSPVMTMQQVVGRCQGHFTSQAFVQCCLDLTDDEHPTAGGLLQKGSQKLTLLLQTHVLTFASTRCGDITCACNLSIDESPTQLTGPAKRHANELRCLRQAQPMLQWQYNGLGLAQLFHRLSAGNGLAGSLQYLFISAGRT